MASLNMTYRDYFNYYYKTVDGVSPPKLPEKNFNLATLIEIPRITNQQNCRQKREQSFSQPVDQENLQFYFLPEDWLTEINCTYSFYESVRYLPMIMSRVSNLLNCSDLYNKISNYELPFHMTEAIYHDCKSSKEQKDRHQRFMGRARMQSLSSIHSGIAANTIPREDEKFMLDNRNFHGEYFDF